MSSLSLARQLRHQAALGAVLAAGLIAAWAGGSRLLDGASGNRLATDRTVRFFLLRPDRRLVGECLQLEARLAGLLGLDRNAHRAALLELAEEHLVGERLLDVLLDHAAERPRTHALVVTL